MKKRIFRLFCLLSLLFFVFYFNACSSITRVEIPQSGVSRNGRLKVIEDKDGIMRLANEKGAFISLRGMSTYNFNRVIVGEGSQNLLNSNAFSALRKDWNCNVIRLAVYVRAEDNGYNGMKEQTLNNIDKAVQLATDNDMYVIIDWHVLSPGDPTDDVYKYDEEFFTNVAQKYGKSKNVMFEIMNEPHSYTLNDQDFWTHIKPYAQKMVNLIRKYSKNIIIIGNPCWSQRPDICAQDPVEGENLMYSVHFYAGSHGEELRNNILAALEGKVAVFCTEWGTTTSDGGQRDKKIYASETDVWLDFLDEHKISWCNWSMAAKREASSALKVTTSLNPEKGYWEEGEISESGQYVRARLRSYSDIK
ncbi:MAG TPA: glycoside hydrolase family 5 protein [Clostridiales bacterium]|nr:glycoside hydrolase family 5 protein [Clostridiales bacterium]